jgi:hypothetical protein
LYTSKGPHSQQQYNNTVACLCLLSYLAFLRPKAHRSNSVLPWVLSRGNSYEFLWADSAIWLCKQGRSDSGLSSHRCAKPFTRRLLMSIGREEHEAPMARISGLTSLERNVSKQVRKGTPSFHARNRQKKSLEITFGIVNTLN